LGELRFEASRETITITTGWKGVAKGSSGCCLRDWLSEREGDEVEEKEGLGEHFEWKSID
jgi:hypothetical protein